MGSEIYRGRIQVIYPLSRGRMVLRTEPDWDRDIEPVETELGHRFNFDVVFHRPHLHFKPCVRDGGELYWAEGANRLALLTVDEPSDTYPHFYAGRIGRITETREFPSSILERPHRFRVYLPAGYEENYLKRYPVLYIQDGKSLFFSPAEPDDVEWMTEETRGVLDSMNLIDRTIIVGIHAGDRFQDYTRPGYQVYGRSVVTELKPWIDRCFRTLSGPRHTAVMGSDLGGVASFFMAWEWPGVFGNAGCLSSRFSFRDDLIERVRHEPRRPREGVRIYLDSGWPGESYESTLSLANALVERGFKLGREVMYLAFPGAAQNDGSWAARCHLPLQLFSGKVRRGVEQPGISAQELRMGTRPPMEV